MHSLGWQPGCCAPPGRAAALKQLGYDIIEITSLDLQGSDEHLRSLQCRLAQVGLPTTAVNGCYLQAWSLVVPNVERGNVARCLERTLIRAAQIGIKVVVWGSHRHGTFR